MMICFSFFFFFQLRKGKTRARERERVCVRVGENEAKEAKERRQKKEREKRAKEEKKASDGSRRAAAAAAEEKKKSTIDEEKKNSAREEKTHPRAPSLSSLESLPKGSQATIGVGTTVPASQAEATLALFFLSRCCFFFFPSRRRRRRRRRSGKRKKERKKVDCVARQALSFSRSLARWQSSSLIAAPLSQPRSPSNSAATAHQHDRGSRLIDRRAGIGGKRAPARRNGEAAAAFPTCFDGGFEREKKERERNLQQLPPRASACALRIDSSCPPEQEGRRPGSTSEERATTRTILPLRAEGKRCEQRERLFFFLI